MEIFKDYEKKVLSLLVSSVFLPEELNDIFRNCKFLSYEYTECGYFLNVSHPSFSNDRIVCYKPTVIGEANGITCGFVIFIADKELTLECHEWDESNITEDFREKDVQVRAVTIEEGKFVDLNTNS